MKVIWGLEELEESPESPVVTIGNFDGVHLGHRKIFSRVVDVASRMGGASMAITFEPHPVQVLAPERDVRLLTPTDQKIRLIGESGIDLLLLIRFNKDFSRLSPDDFIRQILVEKLKVKHVIVGHNYRFGKGKKGTTRMLRNYGRRYGFTVNVVRNMKIGGFTVSSTRVRQLLQWGRVCEASSFLGRSYSIHGTVIKGAGRGGRILNTPTANITTPHELIPKEGVYVVKVSVEGNVYDGVANIGKNPTFGGRKQSYEVHLLDFKGNILKKDIVVYFIDRIRGEKTFPSADALREQITRDIDTARVILKEYRVDIKA